MQEFSERELALQIIFAQSINKDSFENNVKNIKSSIENFTENFTVFAHDLALNTVIHQEQLNQYIVPHLKDWDLQRLPFVIQSIIKMAISEFLFFKDIPAQRTINNYVEIAKKYADDKDVKFCHAIMDKIYKELQLKQEIEK